MEIQRTPFYVKLLPSIFADETGKQFVIAPDLMNCGSTELVYFNERNVFYFIKRNKLNLVQSCFLVDGLQWLENVSHFDMVIEKMNNFCYVNHCSSGYEALCHWEKENAIKLKRLYCWKAIFKYAIGRKKLEKVKDSLTFVKAMKKMEALRFRGAEEFTKNPGNVINRELKRVCRDQQRFEKSECKCNGKVISMVLSGATIALGTLGWYYTK